MRTETFTASDGTEIAFHRIDGGDADASRDRAAPPAIVVGGGPLRGVEYLEDLAGVAADRPLVVLHPRGTPTTGGTSRGFWRDADDLVELADRLGLAEADVVAHSAGTRLALAALARHPERVRTLALLTPAAAWFVDVERDGVEIGRARRDPLVDAALASLTGDEPVDQAGFDRAREIEGPAGYARWGERERVHSAVGAWSLASIDGWFSDIPEDAVARILAAPRHPTLVIAGDQDILVGVRTVEAYAAALGADLVMLDSCGHYPWVEQPAAFRSALGGWLTQD
ncbi:alpha/beta fold hydrolase [Agromyces salentinus]|uniref:Alpha/beta hydrolase n=1 Tax=Agromyces salentinus TaxID=269421 RepID=A0ABN2MJY7_9MICO|nr:alpha/beta hydrolase [Agromyces salentinus]